MIDNRPKTIFCDIDGTLTKQIKPHQAADPDFKLELLPGTIETLEEWDKLGYKIILTTGRKESMRSSTEIQLKRVGIFYDLLIMGLGGGKRILINNMKSNSDIEYALSFNLPINYGITNLQI